MPGWKILSEETAKEIWNENLIRLANHSAFQTFEQGQLENSLGWQPQYWVYLDEKGEIKTMFLGLLRQYALGIGFVWSVGGPAGEVTNCDESLQREILARTNLKHLYLRVRWDCKYNIRKTLFLRSKNWQRSPFTMTSGLTMTLDISVETKEISTAYSKSWQRNLRLAKNQSVLAEKSSNPNIVEIRKVLAEMEMWKNLPVLFSYEKLEKIFKENGQNLVFFQAKDEAGNLLAFRAALLVGKCACDFIAATSHKGRELRASYLLFDELTKYLQQAGVKQYDLGGIDPSGNPGVYTFKKKTGAREVELLGEWEWASSEWLRLFGNLAIYKREKIKKLKLSALLNYVKNPFKKASRFFVKRTTVSESVS